MREIVGKEVTLKDLFVMIKKERDEKYLSAYLSLVESTLTPFTMRRVQKRSVKFMTKEIDRLLKEGYEYEEMNGMKVEGYLNDNILALEDAIEWEMSLFGIINRLIRGRELLDWNRPMTIEEIRG